MAARTILALIALAVTTLAYAADPIDLATFVAISRPEPTFQLRYGPAPSQAIDVFLPASAGPHPVAVLVHGGCWSTHTAGREQLRHLGAELARRGIAVWSIGYRRADESGGGYPGTFQDAGDAIDRLRSEAPKYNLDIARTVLVGHSAGGHLALWAAVRGQLPADSQLHRETPFVPRAVISLAGIGDLKAFAPLVPMICGPGIIERLMGASPAGSRDRYADISPAALPAPEGHVVMISGILDRLVPPYVAYDYARAMRAKLGAPVELVDVPQAGHFDLVTLGTPAWAEVNRRIEAELGVGP
ncbi:MAG: alpha/beta hydrolase [Methylocella sp.]|nr:MAG: alpha/beta hydrolase [Hyphomicrobiales bacterium]